MLQRYCAPIGITIKLLVIRVEYLIPIVRCIKVDTFGRAFSLKKKFASLICTSQRGKRDETSNDNHFRDFCLFSEANSESIKVYVSIGRFQPLGYYIAGALRSQPSQNSPHLDAFSPLLRLEGRNIEMEASSGRVWLQIFRNNRIGLYAMVPQVLLPCATRPFCLAIPLSIVPVLTFIVRPAPLGVLGLFLAEGPSLTIAVK